MYLSSKHGGKKNSSVVGASRDPSVTCVREDKKRRHEAVITGPRAIPRTNAERTCMLCSTEAFMVTFAFVMLQSWYPVDNPIESTHNQTLARVTIRRRFLPKGYRSLRINGTQDGIDLKKYRTKFVREYFISSSLESSQWQRGPRCRQFGQTDHHWRASLGLQRHHRLKPHGS